MFHRKIAIHRHLGALALAAAVWTLLPCAALAQGERVVSAPAPKLDVRSSATSETAYFAGGCFWGVEGVFSYVTGVTSSVSGYGGANGKRPVSYEEVSGGQTGYAEVVRVTFDPRVVSYGTLLRIFFSVITDPTTLNYQGPDHGTQYRSALFPQSADQEKVAKAYLAQLGEAKLWDAPIVTKIEAVGRFQPAEGYHQNFMENNPTHGYIRAWDAPKLKAFKAMYPQLVSARPAK
jgi:peptide-methionine (S)-S-oxide reductase